MRWICSSAAVGAALSLASGSVTAYMTPTVPVCNASSCNPAGDNARNGSAQAVSAAKPSSSALSAASKTAFDRTLPQQVLTSLLLDPRFQRTGFNLAKQCAMPDDMSKDAHCDVAVGQWADRFLKPSSAADGGNLAGTPNAARFDPALPLTNTAELPASGALGPSVPNELARNVAFQAPAPGTLALLGLGAFGFYWLRRRAH